MRGMLQSVGWLACVVYSTIPAFWLMIHPFAERWRARRRSPYRVLVPMWMAMWVVTALITVRWRQVALYQTPWVWIPALVLFAVGLYLYSRSGKNFSPKQLGGLPEVHGGHGEQRLVTEGIRARVRHPVYLAHLCEMLAWSLGTGLAVCWGLTAFAMVTGAVMIRMEDAELEARFGEEFRKYRSGVPAVLPRASPPEVRPLLSSDGQVIRYEVHGKAWQIAISDLCCVAEYTNNHGPYADDWFLIFAIKDGLYYEASVYSDGRDQALEEIGTVLGCELKLELYRSTEHASRVIWPTALSGRAFFEDKAVNPEVIRLTESRQL